MSRRQLRRVIGVCRPRAQALTLGLIGCGMVLSAPVAAQVAGVRLDLAPAVATIGTGDGPAPTRFNTITDVAVDRDGRIYVLDARLGVVRSFAPEGSFLTEALGPSRLRLPETVFLDAGGVSVYDRANVTVRQFAFGKAGLSFKRDVQVPGAGRTACVLDGVLHTTGAESDSLVFARRADGSIDRAFGTRLQVAPDDPDVLKASLSQQRMLCLDSERLIVVASQVLPEVRAYRRDGSLAWQTRLGDFKQIEIKRRGTTGILFGYGDGYDYLSNLVELGKGTLAVQIARRTKDNLTPGSRPAIITRFLSVADGKEIGEQRDLPTIGFSRGSKAYVVELEPYPHVTVRSYTLTAQPR